MASYRITQRAQRDLEGIWDYTAEKWSLDQAEEYIDGLLACFDDIGSGKAQSKSIDHIREGYRRVNCKRHIVFFKIGVDQVGEIIRVLHSSMDIESRLSDE